MKAITDGKRSGQTFVVDGGNTVQEYKDSCARMAEDEPMGFVTLAPKPNGSESCRILAKQKSRTVSGLIKQKAKDDA